MRSCSLWPFQPASSKLAISSVVLNLVWHPVAWTYAAFKLFSGMLDWQDTFSPLCIWLYRDFVNNIMMIYSTPANCLLIKLFQLFRVSFPQNDSAFHLQSQRRQKTHQDKLFFCTYLSSAKYYSQILLGDGFNLLVVRTCTFQGWNVSPWVKSTVFFYIYLNWIGVIIFKSILL